MASARILRAARARITDPANWTQGEFARDAEGLVTCPTSAAAVCWCALGALEAECPYGGGAEINALRRSIAVMFPGVGDVAVVNDSSEHAAVLALFDDAIANAEARF